ncbi:LacI family DNA-binding transcriptional regulator [Microbacterium sp.]|uniref:LacI family DNA-binding transcriptional regulator n=1 Tax=Microbacterium sp. TaxID=51671 RepID=UPI0039E3A5F2
MKPPTIYDVARSAGVSHQTVTRYLHGFQGIRPETRDRVQAAIAELGYLPNSAARQLRHNRINVIGLLAHRVDMPGPARMVVGVIEAARQNGYLIELVATEGQEPDEIDAALDQLLEHQHAGLIIESQYEGLTRAIEARELRVPHVLATSRTLTSDDTTTTTNHQTGRMAAAHLLGLGHHDIGYVSGPRSWYVAKERRDGFVAELAAAGREPVWEAEGDWSPSSGAAAWRDRPRSAAPVTAVALGNDAMAIGLISAANSSGVAVPTELSVIGNDNMPEAAYVTPPLTTVAIDFEAEGAFLVATLLGKITGRTPPNPLPAPRLLVRASTTALR